MNISIRCIVSGQVQGVGFRMAAQRQAEALGLSGWARNCPDGTVEVVAVGDEDTVMAMREWLWRGPSMAQVENVVCEPTEAGPVSDFRIR